MTRNLLVALSLIVLSACSNTPDWDYDKSVEFANYKTFSWSPDTANFDKGADNYQISELMEKRVRNAIITEMTQHGITLVEGTKADVMVNFHAAVDTKLDVDTFNTSYSARWNYWGVGWHTQTQAREYEVGTLVIDIIDSASNQLVWRGAKEGRLRKKQSPEKRTESVNNTVKDILANFPPKVEH
ncbi:DUF4136 domain-containing protein [Pseudoalteromonas luteoviolacea]|uniref:DUF4136 domain-containing protein n=1 Tax=Pseudoalteromonas luteoviolacea H33 TaxID=1365251 RepID=A0A167FFT0_9GAMM|nr:DUF4136 domain-containing protein [Pseudoalteromonas luteoviolacea]KZN52236.1 hypothetical protein N476_11395 [Pseudoalteromonas luteoviolacea H33]KZN77129.1 hypothetical protein N477_12910 [Pseudoalteromonas luteoviolacea H33-S]MBQ4877305.1 DUF4136 domain-containing protein [Pseudoalteromonas luteoviolacea]MBQ4906166.1 DUF4136 domain-containing protein [Pseudoalteromonas luteoviolacea]